MINRIISQFEKLLRAEIAERDRSGGLPLPKPTIRVLGQMALSMDRVAASQLPIVMTADLDALIIATSSVGHLRTLLKQVLSQNNLTYDDLSTEIWLPPGHEFILYYDSSQLRVEFIDPISNLVAKAIKAPAKNRPLIVEALKIYGEQLPRRIIENGGSLEPFISSKKPTL